KYGLGDPPDYLRGLGADQVVANLTSRRVTYLLGGSDTRDDEDLDTDCAARVQGANRLQRGTFFFDWFHRTYPAAAHQRVVVPGTGHDSAEMFSSTAALPVLFAP